MNNASKIPAPFVYILIFALSFILPGCATGSKSVNAEGWKSLEYRLVETVAVFSGHKKDWDRDLDSLKKHLLKTDQSKRRIPPAKLKKKFTISETTIQGRQNYIIAPKENSRNDKVVMYFHGGGFVYEMFPFDWDAVEKIVHDLSVPVVVPIYPVYPETNPDTIVSFVKESYEYTLKAFPEAEISMIGTSAGADLILSLCHYLTQTNSGLPFPGKLICISPAMIVGIDDATLGAMNEIAPHDVILSMRMLETLPVLFNIQDKLNFFSAPFYGDFSKFPPVYIFSGTYDIFYPQMAPFVKRMRDQGKQVSLHTGYKLMHAWPLMPISPECKETMSIILDIVRR
jgi:acetyl esterase/lipase